MFLWQMKAFSLVYLRKTHHILCLPVCSGTSEGELLPKITHMSSLFSLWNRSIQSTFCFLIRNVSHHTGNNTGSRAEQCESKWDKWAMLYKHVQRELMYSCTMMHAVSRGLLSEVGNSLQPLTTHPFVLCLREWEQHTCSQAATSTLALLHPCVCGCMKHSVWEEVGGEASI